MAMVSENDPDFVTALARGLVVITCFGPDADELTLAQVAAKAELSRGTARRFLLTLETLGYVRSDGRLFRLTPKTLNLGYAYLASLPLWKAAEPIMKDVVDELDEPCSLGVLDGHEIVYVARVPPKHLSFIPVHLGSRMPAHINAMGRVLLAELAPDGLDAYFSGANFERVTKNTVTDEAELRRILARVARDGYALSDGQVRTGIRSIAVPIRSRSGRAEVAINTTADESRASKREMIERFLPVLRSAASQLERSL